MISDGTLNSFIAFRADYADICICCSENICWCVCVWVDGQSAEWAKVHAISKLTGSVKWYWSE